MFLQKKISQFEHICGVWALSVLNPNQEIIAPLRCCRRRFGLRCAGEILLRFVQARRRGMKGQFGQSDPRLRSARVPGEITQETLQRVDRFLTAICRLDQSFLESHLGARFLVAGLFLKFIVIGQKTSVIAELKPADGGVEK